MIVVMRELMGTSVLAGATAGAQAMAELIQATAGSNSGVVYLDFDGVEAATGSFMRECVLGFRDYCRRVRGTIYPVIANSPSVVEEELRDILFAMNDAFVSCQVTRNGKPTGAKVIGRLEQRQVETLYAVIDAGVADANMLAKCDEDVGPTAWNNRLAALVSKGLLTEQKSGRQKLYSPVLKGLRYGS